MEKKKVAIVTLGDSRREFYKKRETIVASEIEKVKKAFGDKYDLYISPIVFDAEDGQNISDEIKKQGIEAVIIHVPIWATPSLAFRIAYGTSYPVMLLGNLQRNTSSLVTLLAVGGMLDQTGKKCIRVSGDYEDPQIQEKVDNFVKGVYVAEGIRRSSYGMIGGIAFTAFGFLMKPEFLLKWLHLPQERIRIANIIFGWISPLNHATYYMHNFGYDNLPRLWVSYLFFAGGSLILFWLSLLKMRTYAFCFSGTQGK